MTETSVIERTDHATRLDAELLERLVDAAILAPSPDNNQPWRFRAGDDAILVAHDRSRALPSDLDDRFDLLALGASIENLVLEAGAAGQVARVEIRPDDGSDLAPVAEVRLRPGGVLDPLHRWLPVRKTNRRPYRRRPVTEDRLSRLSSEAGSAVAVHWLATRPEIRRFARLVATTDRVRFEHRPFHEELHRQLRLDPLEARRTRDGLDLETLEVPPGTGTLLASLRPWRRASALHRLGLGGILSVPSAAQAAASGAIGLLTVAASRREDFLAAGRAFQRLWLRAEAEGLSLQPLGSPAAFLELVRRDADADLTPSNRHRLRRAARDLETMVPALVGRTLLLAFRLGEARRAPSARSRRRPAREAIRPPETRTSVSPLGLPPAVADRLGQDLDRDDRYGEAFCRNLGLVSGREQDVLRRSRVAIAGLGGVGGIHLATLARLGIGSFSIADPDRFETVNTNRQYGALASTVGRRKVSVMAEIARDIHPEVELRRFEEALTAESLDDFLQGADVVVDGLDAFEIDIRRSLFRRAAERGIPAITAGPIGFSTAWLVFDPAGMSFDRYFDLHDDMTDEEKFAAFVVGLVPGATQRPYLDPESVSVRERRGPSVSSACQLAAGVTGAEVVKLLLGRGKVPVAPVWQQFDPYRGVLARGRLRRGNRGLWPRLKRWWVRETLRRNVGE